MVARSVQISLDEELLNALDSDPETEERGRSSVIRRAIRLYLDLKRRKQIDDAYERGYGSDADEVLKEFEYLLGTKAWPDE